MSNLIPKENNLVRERLEKTESYFSALLGWIGEGWLPGCSSVTSPESDASFT